MLKPELRRKMRAVLASLPAELRARDAAAVVAPLLAIAGAGPVALFASLGNELDTGPLDDALRERGFVRVLPQVHADDLVFRSIPSSVRSADLPRASYGAPEPTVDFPAIALSTCSLVIVPGLAFDIRGGRIGYGRGYYDRALANVDVARAVGLGYDAQIIDDVPMVPTDVRLTQLCTPARGVFRVGA